MVSPVRQGGETEIEDKGKQEDKSGERVGATGVGPGGVCIPAVTALVLPKCVV